MPEYDLVTCRRENYIQAAMVQAAISIQQTHGTGAAIAVLEAEKLSQDVIDRVLTAKARKRLSPYSALERPASLLPA
jgi:DNA-binding TFAR19-related protein (PDSD5 family)